MHIRGFKYALLPLLAAMALYGCTTPAAPAPTPTSVDTPTAARPTFTPAPTATSEPVASYPAPEGSRVAIVRARGTLIVEDGAGQQRELLVTDAIADLTWVPDGSHIVYVDRDLSQEVNFLKKEELWIVDVETGERNKIGTGFAPQISPGGRYVAFFAGVPWGDACAVGYDLAILELDGGMSVVTTYAQDDFAALAVDDAKMASFYPVSIEWRSETELVAGMRWGCVAPDEPGVPESGLYLLEVETLQAEKIAELTAD